MEKYTYIIIAIVSLLAGGFLHFMSTRNGKQSNANMVLAWLLIALFPVFLILPLFPDSTASGTIFNFTLSGAIGAFVLIWWYGSQRVIKIGDADALTAENTQLKADLETAKNATPVGGTTPIKRAKPLTTTEKHTYTLKGQGNTSVGLITGDIRNVKGVDIWVNSENTNMEMARFYENSISGILRYMGARKDGVGNVREDLIADMLRREVGNNLYVQPATVLATGAGELEGTNQVKKILHAAAVHGEVGTGYQPVRNIQNCVKNALTKADAVGGNLTSILLPLFATGLAEGDTESISEKLINEAVTYLQSNPDSQLRDVYFLTYTDEELNDCLKVLDKHPNLKN